MTTKEENVCAPVTTQIRRRTVSAHEAAIISGLCDREIRNLLRKGKLKGVKVGSKWLVNLDALLERLGIED